MREVFRRLVDGSGALVLIPLVMLAAPAAAAASPLWGIDLTGNVSSGQLARVASGGAGSVRAPLLWQDVIREPGGPPDWSTFDPVVEGAATAGLEVLPSLGGPPAWAIPTEQLGGGDTAPRNLPVRTPQERLEWMRFLRLAADRYGPAGSFWKEHPSLERQPIHLWQIWNEPNFEYFAARPNPAEYGRLVQISHRTLTSVDPRAKVMLAGLFGRPSGSNSKAVPKRAYFASTFLDRMLKSNPGISADFAAVALHPYAYSWRELAPQIEEVRAVLRAHRDGAKPLWITELGWSSRRPDAANGYNGFEKGPKGQARELSSAFRLLRKGSVRWRLQRVFWFSLTDEPGLCNFCDGSGLFDRQFQPKPSWRAFMEQAGGPGG